MAKMPRIALSPAEVQARAMQLENDTAARSLVRRAMQLEATASRAGDGGNMATARTKMGQARVLRAAAGRLVLKDRPSSLGVPMWLGEGVVQASAQGEAE